MMKYECPLCGIGMQIELGGTLIAHPSKSTCPAAGKAFRKERAREDDKRPTFAEFVEKTNKAAEVPGLTLEAPVDPVMPPIADQVPVPGYPSPPDVPGVPAAPTKPSPAPAPMAMPKSLVPAAKPE